MMTCPFDPGCPLKLSPAQGEGAGPERRSYLRSPHKGGDDCISGCQNTKLLQAKNIGCPGCRRQNVEILN